MFDIKVWAGPLGEALLPASAASGGFRLYLVCASISPISVSLYMSTSSVSPPFYYKDTGIIIECWLISSQDP